MITTRQLVRRWFWGLGVFAVLVLVVWQIGAVATLLLLSFLVAYVLNPLVTRLEKVRFFNRMSATFVTLFAVLVVFLAIFFVVFPEIIADFKQFLGRVPGAMVRFQDWLVPWVERTLDVSVPTSVGEAMDQFGRDINKIIGPATKMAAGLFSHTFTAVGAVVAVLMFPFFLFFLLKDFKKITAALDSLIPIRNRHSVHEIVEEVDQSLSAFLHGQFIVMLILGCLYSIGYTIVGIPVALGVGIMTGILCFIPYVGAATGFIMALLLSLLDYQGIGSVFGVVIVFSTVQIFDAILITPRILGGKLGLGPLWIIVALMAGGELFGFLGVLLAVPTVAVLKVLVNRTVLRYKASSLYRSQERSEFGLGNDDEDEPDGKRSPALDEAGTDQVPGQ
jgi:predicted PurR-regulated permease PerM